MNILGYFLILTMLMSMVYSGAVELTDKDFENGKVSNKNGETKEVWFVKFYNPRCPHCKKFAADWDKLSDELSNQENIKFGSLDCAKYRQVCNRFNIWGVPTLLMFKDNFASEYQNSNDYGRVKTFVTSREYDDSGSTERWAIPAI